MEEWKSRGFTSTADEQEFIVRISNHNGNISNTDESHIGFTQQTIGDTYAL